MPIDMSPIWLAPFVVLLACIAIMPLAAKHFWERNYQYVAAALALIAFLYYAAVRHDLHPWLHEMREYVSFIVLLGSLFIISGGIVVNISRKATPAANAVLLVIGAVIANLFGTTGASMLLIRPYLRMNRGHIRPYHVVFFIFIVSNCGGSLTPIGDPPLFLGYLKGVPFWWTTEHLWPMWATCVGILVALFFVIDTIQHGKEERAHHGDGGPAVGIMGMQNFLFILLVVAGVFRPGIFDVIDDIREHGATGGLLTQLIFSREVLMIAAAVASKALTGASIYKHNEFSYGPIREVAILFVAIFSTMAPALEYLSSNAEHMPVRKPGQYYFSSGALSSVLDNAPTYLTFLQVALGKLNKERPEELAEAARHVEAMKAAHDLDLQPRPGGDTGRALDVLEKYHGDTILEGKTTRQDLEVAYLLGVPSLSTFVMAISLGSVFFGACTYIGNGPNFMVKSIADAAGVKTPGFITYIIYYTLPILLPTYILVWAIFLRGPGH